MKNGVKNKLLLVGIVLLLIVCYRFAVRNTLDVRAEYSNLAAKVESQRDTPRQLSILVQKETYYDSILQKMDLGDTSVQNNLLRTLNKESERNKIKVMDFNPPHISSIGESELYTYSFDLSGSYTNILKTVYTLEQKGNFGEVVHLDFGKKKNYRTGKHSLRATVLVRRLR